VPADLAERHATEPQAQPSSSILEKLEVARRAEAAACLARHSGEPTF
jgi:hypothetical protein